MAAKWMERVRALPLPAKIAAGAFLLLIAYESAQQGPVPGGGGSSSQIIELEQQHAALVQQANECKAAMDQNSMRWAQGAMNGEMPTGAPACQEQMPQIIAQMAAIESQLNRYQGGGNQAAGGGYAQGGSQPNYYHPTDPNAPSYNNPDQSLDAVDRWNRNVIRGNSMYTDQDGQQHELETQPNYHQNVETGQYVATPTPAAPDNHSDYTPLTNADDR
jgi:hypothetical protein